MIKTARQLKDLIRNLSKKKFCECTAPNAKLYDGAVPGTYLHFSISG